MATNPAAIQFNGTTHLVKLDARASVRNMGSFTCMAWFATDDSVRNPLKKMWVERQGSGAKVRFSMTPYVNKLRCEFSAKDGVTDTNYDAAFPQWNDQRYHHGAFVGSLGGSNPSYKIVIDGAKVAEGKLVVPAGVTTVEDTASLGVYLGNASYHTSGGETFATDRFWQGKLDDVLIFNTALSESAILEYVQSHDFWDATDTSIFSNYRFVENTGSTAADDDNSGWTATMYTWNSGTSSLAATAGMWVKHRPFLGNGTADTTAPTAPTSPATSAATSDGFTFTFTGNRINDDNIFVHHWEVQLSLVNTFTSIVQTDTVLDGAQSVTYSGLLPNTNYYVRARAVDEAGNTSAWTATQTRLTLTQGDVTPPSPPTALNATSITHTSFLLGFTDAADHAGYKVDVSRSNNFSTFITGYQNKDIGDVTSLVVSGLSALSNIYVRMRTYDTAGNESANSVVLVVQTAPPPDIAPPTQVVLEEASSISSTAWTMNWEASTDDVGVVAYEIDVAYDAAFTLPLMYGVTAVLSYNVGNVLSYRVLGAEPETSYYARVRARDASGKVSVSSDSIQVTTLALSVEDGGLIVAELLPSHAYGVTSAAPTTKSTTLVVSGTGAAASAETYLRFDLTELTGSVASASLSFTATGSIGTGFTLNFTSVLNNVFDMETITWNARPTVGGTIFSADAFASVNVDLSGSIVARNVFLVKITATESGSVTLTNPVLTVETDPISATLPTGVDTDIISGSITNYLRNPSFETTVATDGWTAIGTGTVLTPATHSASEGSGNKYIYVTTTGAATGQGIMLATAHYVAAVAGQTWTFSAGLRYTSGGRGVTLRIQEHDVSNAVLATSTVNVTLAAYGVMQRFSLTRTLTHASTVKISVSVYNTVATATAFDIDMAQLDQSAHMNAYIDGSKPGAFWNGTANDSTSSLNASALQVTSSYIGDSNQDNYAYLTIRPPFQSDIVGVAPWQAVSVNRSTKQWTSLLGPSIGSYNLVPNPSFELGIAWWTAVTATRTWDTEEASQGGASMKVDVTTSTQGVVSHPMPIGAAVAAYARARLLVPLGLTVGMRINYYNASAALISSSTVVTVIGDGSWQDIDTLVTTPALTVYATVSFLSESAAVVASFNVDDVLFSRSALPVAYFDGDMPGAVWDGEAHNSPTSLVILPEQSYDLIWNYSDPDGIVGLTGTQTTVHGITLVMPATPDNATTVQSVTFDPDYTSIDAVVVYSGDDDEDMVASVSVSRSDLSTWTVVPSIINRAQKTINATVEALQPGTSYTVRIVLTDQDGVYNPDDGIIQQNVSTTSTFGIVEGTASVQFNGFELMGGAGGHISVIEHNAFDFPERRIDVKDQPRRHGAVKISDYWGAKEIQMRGVVSGSTRGELAQHVDLLKRTFASSSGLLTVDTLTNQQRYYHATCEVFEAPENGEDNFRHLIWEATFICADPFAYSRDSARVTNTAVTNGSTITLENVGDIDAELQLTVTTSHSYPLFVTLINDTTGEMLRPASAIVSGDYMIMDSSAFSLTRNGLETVYTGSFLHLAPGENSIRILLSSTYTAITPAITLTSVWQSRFI